MPEGKIAAEPSIMPKLFCQVTKVNWLPMFMSFEKFPTDHGPDFVLELPGGSSSTRSFSRSVFNLRRNLHRLQMPKP